MLHACCARQYSVSDSVSTWHILHFVQALRKSLIDQKRIINTVPEAPVFRPTVEEFSDVLEYIASIKIAGEAAGIVKIVPPAGKHQSALVVK